MLSPYMYITSLSTVNLFLDAFYMGVRLWLDVHQRWINKNIKNDAALVLGFQNLMVNPLFAAIL